MYLTTEAAAVNNCRKCPLVKCVVVTPADCKSNELFVKRDGYCHCCDACVKADCPADYCALIDCVPIQPGDCDLNTQVYKKPDGVCNCCGRCVNKTDSQ